MITRKDLFKSCPICGDEAPYPLIIRHNRCNNCRNIQGYRCHECCGDGFVYAENKGNVRCLVAVPCHCGPVRDSMLEELLDMLDCVQSDGSINGLDEFPTDEGGFGPGQVLRGILEEQAAIRLAKGE